MSNSLAWDWIPEAAALTSDLFVECGGMQATDGLITTSESFNSTHLSDFMCVCPLTIQHIQYLSTYR